MLRVRGLTMAFRQHNGTRLVALARQDLTVGAGETVGVIGGSGAGKSLVAAAVLGLLPRNAEVGGSITLDGRPVRTGEIALAPQGIDALDPLARVGTQLRRFVALGRAGPASGAMRAPDLLAEVGLSPDVLRLYPHELSGGMAKRVLLATALAGRARIMIADEPTLGLDPANADRIMALIGGLATAERGVLVISHDLRRMVGIADRILVLRDGERVEDARADAFVGNGERLAHPFTRALWSAHLSPAPGTSHVA
jgi:peptide/nickel transport system ATP-binding protein